jgi:hypothetical protein
VSDSIIPGLVDDLHARQSYLLHELAGVQVLLQVLRPSEHRNGAGQGKAPAARKEELRRSAARRRAVTRKVGG